MISPSVEGLFYGRGELHSWGEADLDVILFADVAPDCFGGEDHLVGLVGECGGELVQESIQVSRKPFNQGPHFLLMHIRHSTRTVLADHVRNIQRRLPILRNAFDDGLALNIGPVHAISAMCLDGLSGVLPEGECCSCPL